MFATYIVNVEWIISEVLMAVLVRECFHDFLLVIALLSASKLPAAREAIPVSKGSCVTSGPHLVSLLWKHSRALPLMVLFITDWQDENKRTKKLGSQVWENLCSLYSNKCLRLASEKFVLASGSNLSLATGLASWKVSLEPWPLYCLLLLAVQRDDPHQVNMADLDLISRSLTMWSFFLLIWKTLNRFLG